MQNSQDEIKFFNRIKESGILSYEQLFKKFYKQLFIYATSFLKNDNESEDLVQEVFLKFWTKKSYKNIFSEKHLNSYLYKAVKNSCINKLEKKDISKYSIDLLGKEAFEEELQAVNEELIERIKADILLLPDRTREVITGIFFNKMKYKEIAEDLEIKPSTVKTLLKSGMVKLREKYKEEVDLLLFLHLI